MNSETIFDLLKSFAERKSQSQNLTLLHYLYGYSQLLGMKAEMVKTLVNSEEDLREYERLTQVVEKLGIDIQILKQGISFLFNKEIASEDAETFVNGTRDVITGRIAIDVLFEKIAGTQSALMEVFKKGNTLEDVIAFGDQQQVSANQQTEKTEQKVSSANLTPNPVTKLQKKEETFDALALRCETLYKTLSEKIYGQDDAIRVFTQGYFQAELTANERKQGTKGLFLFAGPPGVGKTFLATTAADSLGFPAKRFNMSEYSDHQSASELIGIPKKYNGSIPGALTGFVKKNPNSVLIFDEIEKAHLNVIHLFLQILDAGCLRDAHYEENIDFKNTIVIFTTNAGHQLYEENREQNLSLLSQSVVLDALRNDKHPLTGGPMFPAAICSRFATGNVVMFNHLSSHILLHITETNFRKCADSFQEKYGIELTFDSKLPSVFMFHMSSSLDARVISSQSKSFILDELYEFARLSVDQIQFDSLKKIQFVINESDADTKIQQLFTQQRKDCVLVVGNENLFHTDKATFFYANTTDEMEQILLQHDIRFVIVDPMFGYHKGMEKGVFSMEDFDTDGIRSFHALRAKMPHMPIYLLECEKKIKDVDKSTFFQLGAHGFLTTLSEDKSVEDQLIQTLSSAYLQEKVNELARQEKVLEYNTAQMLSSNGETAIIEFYDFKLHTAVKAENKDLVLSDAEKPSVRFKDIIGAENAKNELQFFIQFLKNPKEFLLKGKKAPKGLLLYGPPGTGKTMLAKAMAGEADVTFLPTSATDFAKPYVGESEASIRNLFKTAKKYAPSVIFIDEIDAIAKERTGSSLTHHTESMLNTLLTEMDGFTFDPLRPVFVMAATNFPIDRQSSDGKAAIDPALIRRFSNKVLVDLPTEEERKEFLLLRISKLENCELTEASINNIASRSIGESLANLQNILDLAARNADKAEVPLTDDILLEAMEEFYYGEEHDWGKDYYESVAHHEVGHAYISYLSGKKPKFLTIVSRGDFGGYMQSGDENTPSYSKQDLLWRIRTCLAGRASEIVFFGEEAGTNTGVSSDLESATNIALQMICRYGMSGASMLSISPERILNTPLGERVLMEAQKILETEMQNTIALIREGEVKIKALVKVLLEKNQLVEEEIEAVLKD